MRADHSITHTVENNFATNEHDNCDLDQSVYSEIDEEVQLHRQSCYPIMLAKACLLLTILNSTWKFINKTREEYKKM